MYKSPREWPSRGSAGGLTHINSGAYGMQRINVSNNGPITVDIERRQIFIIEETKNFLPKHDKDVRMKKAEKQDIIQNGRIIICSFTVFIVILYKNGYRTPNNNVLFLCFFIPTSFSFSYFLFCCFYGSI